MKYKIGLVEYALVLVLTAIVVITILTLVAPVFDKDGAVMCPQETYIGQVNTYDDDVYIIKTESGTVRAPKDLCTLKIR